MEVIHVKFLINYLYKCYEITQKVKLLTEGQIALTYGVLYPVLRKQGISYSHLVTSIRGNVLDENHIETRLVKFENTIQNLPEKYGLNEILKQKNDHTRWH